jgi:alpha-tubulin suppressor-like RCC1 family protein
VYAWGSNKYNTLDQANPKVDSVPYPKVLQHLSGTAFRDIALHEKHAACVDARGDVYQWGDGIFQGDAKPRLTLAGQV